MKLKKLIRRYLITVNLTQDFNRLTQINFNAKRAEESKNLGTKNK